MIKMSEPEYRALPAINQSTLKILHSQTPYHCKFAMDNSSEQTDSMRVGSAVHCLVLEPEIFDQSYKIGPTKTRAAKAWLDEAEIFPGELLTDSEMAKVQSMSASLFPIIEKLKTKSTDWLTEIVALSMRDGIELKAKIDIYDGAYVYDIKTTADISYQGIMRSIINYQYDFQAAFYIDSVLDNSRPVQGYRFIFIESKPPYAVNPVVISPEWIEVGRTNYLTALARFARCREKNRWPGFGSEFSSIDMPGWYASLNDGEIEFL